MARVLNDIARAPAANEIEISLFGPGYGESIVVHLGAGAWMVVDSCRDTRDGSVAPLSYLESLGVSPTGAVRAIVASHWHDDHVCGLGDVVRVCANANFICASALTKKEFTQMVRRYDEGDFSKSGPGVREMATVLSVLRDSDRRPIYAAPNRPILTIEEIEPLAGGHCIVTTLSPSDRQIELFWDEIARLMPVIQTTRRRARTAMPNNVAIALWVEIGHDALLLGSDLEEGRDPHTGWSVIVSSRERPSGKAAVYKVPHHGSRTAHCGEAWKSMVGERAAAILTPFVRGGIALPTPEDVARIQALSSESYSTSHMNSRAPSRRSPEVERTIRETVGKIWSTEPKFGHIRLRKKMGLAVPWATSLYGSACRLSEVWG